MTQSLHETFGGLSLPVGEEDVDTTLAPLDPGRDAMLALFAAALNAEFGAAWVKVAGQLRLDPEKFDLENPVGDTYPGEPTPAVMQERKGKFPLMAVHRSGEHEYEAKTLELDQLRQPWEVHYILGPLSVEGVRKLYDVLISASKVLRRTVERRGHPAYLDGEEIFFPDGLAPFSTCEVRGGQMGQAHFAGDEKQTPYYALTLRLETTEIARVTEGSDGGPFIATDYSFGIGDGPGGEGVIHGLLYATTDQVTI